MCDTDSFGSRLSGNGGNGNGALDYNNGSAGKQHHIKEEIENDEDYFQLLANQTRAMRHLDGKKSSRAQRSTQNAAEKFLHDSNMRNSRLGSIRSLHVPSGADPVVE